MTNPAAETKSIGLQADARDVMVFANYLPNSPTLCKYIIIQYINHIQQCLDATEGRF